MNRYCLKLFNTFFLWSFSWNIPFISDNYTFYVSQTLQIVLTLIKRNLWMKNVMSLTGSWYFLVNILNCFYFPLYKQKKALLSKISSTSVFLIDLHLLGCAAMIRLFSEKKRVSVFLCLFVRKTLWQVQLKNW